MVVFRNKASGNHFAVNNKTSEIFFISQSESSCLRKFSRMFGDISYLDLPDLKAVNDFRKALSKNKILENVPFEDTRKVLIENYPEFFI